jgi:hypothetical protein
VAQLDAKFGKLEFSEVMMRLPGSDGVVYVTAPYAEFNRAATEEIILGTHKDRPVDGPVRFIGRWNGDLFMGRAQRGKFIETGREMSLHDVEIVGSGARQHVVWVAINQVGELPYGGTKRLTDVPALTAALAALPVQLALPPMRQ